MRPPARRTRRRRTAPSSRARAPARAPSAPRREPAQRRPAEDQRHRRPGRGRDQQDGQQEGRQRRGELHAGMLALPGPPRRSTSRLTGSADRATAARIRARGDAAVPRDEASARRDGEVGSRDGRSALPQRRRTRPGDGASGTGRGPPSAPPDTWPAALRNMVRIVLTSRFSMWAAWGPELTTFYNDAYWRDTLQAKHPWALGRPAAEMWAEIWHDIGPRIRSVLETGVATWDEDLLLFLERSGYPEETYHTFSYSPLDGDDGRTEGMLCVVAETTERVSASAGWPPSATSPRPSPPPGPRRDVLAAVVDQLARNRADLPFSLTYLFDDAGTARLGGAAGIAARRRPAAPVVLGADDADPAWPLARHPRRGAGAGRRPRRPASRACRPAPGSGHPTQAVAVPLDRRPRRSRGPVAGFLVVGLNPHRALRRRLPRLRRAAGRPDRLGPGQRRQLRGRAPPGRGAGRARPRQDRLLLQRQPRVPDAAHADHGAARRAAGLPRPGRRPARPRGARGHRAQRAAPGQARQHPAGLLPAAGRAASTRASSRSTSP